MSKRGRNVNTEGRQAKILTRLTEYESAETMMDRKNRIQKAAIKDKEKRERYRKRRGKEDV